MKPNKVDAIGFAALVGVAALAYFGLIRGQTQRLNALRQQNAMLTQVLLQNEGLEKELERDRSEVAPLQEKLNAFAGSFVRRNEIDAFLQHFATDAERTGVSVNLLRPGEPQKQLHYQYTPITLHLEGRFPAIYALLHGIDYGKNLAVIEELQFQGEPEKEIGRGALILNLFLKPEEASKQP
ncbi:MAG TPA: type 4a pilus biogenesis protein PilO [Planctomycetota bacterium]|nr:type 4a pilus biogenesis protein PilO [Planctomycetota bacterium]